MKLISYAATDFSPDVIRHAVWLYLRFTLSYWDVEDLLAERGLMISNESIRPWVLKFGPIAARNLRKIRPKTYGDSTMSGTDENDPYDLQRFLDAQSPFFEQVRAELLAGQKRGHWIWFIFPQIKGLGHSPTANKFAIFSRAEAEAYLKHPILGSRLRDCTALVIQIEGRSIDQILGYPDNLKFRSSMTLFAHATVDNQQFESALQKYFGGGPDPLTLERL
jgi:uncharacterized protein (DUF1810 family)